MNYFSVTDLPLAGLKRIARNQIEDDRGFLCRIFCAEELAEVGWNKPIAQVNHTYTIRRGTVRGMHYQRKPSTEMKLISCIRGEVLDVAVDLRVGSHTFLHWYSEILSVGNKSALLMPEGFAHGFQTLSDEVELIYCHSAAYSPDAEAGLNPKDPMLAITWPLTITEISLKDAKHPLIDSNFQGVFL